MFRQSHMPIGLQVGNYRLVVRLGEGGFAEVYLGQHVHIKSMQAAIKILHARLPKETQAQFLHEAETIVLLKHPNIIHFIDFGIVDETPYLIMDYMANGTLRERHPRGHAIPLETVVSYVKQIAEALQYAHDRKIIHRDLKPENILIGENDKLVLGDFGISIPAHDFHSLTPQIEHGTPAYMAPEHFQKQAILASDQYSLGIIVYEWLCGQLPFTGSPAQLMDKHINIHPPSLCEKISVISPAVNQVVMKSLEKNQANRYPTIQTFALALEDALVSYIPPTMPANPFTPTPPPSGNFPVGVQPVAPVPLRGVSSPQYPSPSQPFPGIRPTIPVQPIIRRPVPPTLPVPGNYPGNCVQPVPSPLHPPLPRPSPGRTQKIWLKVVAVLLGISVLIGGAFAIPWGQLFNPYPYPSYMVGHGTLIDQEPLSNPNNWPFSDPNNCSVENDTLHILTPSKSQSCNVPLPVPDNFALETQLKVTYSPGVTASGNDDVSTYCGAIDVFTNDTPANYILELCSDSTYTVQLGYTQNTYAVQGTPKSIPSASNENGGFSILGIVESSSSLIFYVNQRQVAQFYRDYSNTPSLYFYAEHQDTSVASLKEVNFSNLETWD